MNAERVLLSRFGPDHSFTVADINLIHRMFLGAIYPWAGIFRIARQVAAVHAELLLIHPYRERNGRTARLLATFMAYQAGQPGIDFGFIGSRGKQFDRYVAAIHAGLNGDCAGGVREPRSSRNTSRTSNSSPSSSKNWDGTAMN